MILAMPTHADETLYDETVNVSSFSYRGVQAQLDEGTDLIITIQVVSGNDISFYLCDANNYNRWKSGYEASAYITRFDIVSTELNFEVPRDDTYYFILDNMDSFTGVSVRLTIVQETGMCLGTIAIVTIPIAALVSLVALKRRK